MLKSIESMFFRRGIESSFAAPHVARFTMIALSRVVAGARAVTAEAAAQRKKSLFSGSSADAEGCRLDAMAACRLADDALSGPPTPARLNILRLAVDTLRDCKA